MADHDHEAAAPAPDSAQEPPDAKARFRAALERKKDGSHRSAESRRNTGVVHGAEVAAGSKRTFRRKTG